MIRLRGQLICATSEESAAVQAHVAEHTRLSRAEPGCLSFEVTPTDDPLRWEVLETFRTQTDFNAHQARTRASDWFDATHNILRDFRVEAIGD